eukprot:c52283_g1_i1.p2 GENE.c52283_g1_i1~~c52283_g1_i1.p2  ORF type:complete len:484 (-),score=101.48 c52283_g1_i1:68-1519(-)
MSSARRVAPDEAHHAVGGAVGAEEAPTMTLYQSLQQEETSESVRKSVMDWARLRVSSGAVTDADVALMSRYDSADPGGKTGILAHPADGAALAGALLRALKSTLPTKRDALYYLLTMIHDIIASDEASVQRDRVALFVAGSGTDRSLPYSPFTRLLNQSETAERDDYVIFRASGVVAILVDGDVPLTEEESTFLVKWCAGFLGSLFHIRTRYAAVSLLQKLVAKQDMRLMFWRNSAGFDMLVRLISPETRPIQIVYQAAYCIWLMSYSKELAPVMESRQPLLAPMVEVLRSTPKEYEKVFRVVLAALANLCKNGSHSSSLVNSGYLRIHPLLVARAWKDADIAASLDVLSEALRNFESDESTFGLYREEILSEELKPSAVHESDAFWRLNIEKFAWEDYRILRVLVRILGSTGRTPQVLQLAAWDVGEFVRVHPDGKRIVEALGGKAVLLTLMESTDADVQAAAVVAMQKLMVKNLDYLSKKR